MIERKLRYTLSAVAWVAALMSSMALFSSALSVAAAARHAAASTAEAHNAP